MFTLEVENRNGAKLKLTQNENNYQIVNVSGLTPPKAKIVTTTVANMDGAKFKSSKIETRNIVLQIHVKGEVEKNRIALYDFLDVGQLCKIYYTNGSRKVYIEGYCETPDGDLFTNKQILQFSILCAEPFWKDLNLMFVDISYSLGLFEFPFAIDSEGIEFENYVEKRETNVINAGEVPCGAIITLTAKSNYITNPIIYKVATGEYLKLNTTMNLNDVIVINTNKGQKGIYKIVGNEKVNIIGVLETGSTWFQLDKGSNVFTFESEENADNLKVVFEFNNLFKGV